jgi:hypothetical protein
MQIIGSEDSVLHVRQAGECHHFDLFTLTLPSSLETGSVLLIVVDITPVGIA